MNYAVFAYFNVFKRQIRFLSHPLGELGVMYVVNVQRVMYLAGLVAYYSRWMWSS